MNYLSGKVIWKTGSEKAGYASPIPWQIYGTEQIIFFIGDGLRALTPDSGKVLWSFNWITKYDVNAASLITHKNTIFVSSGYKKGGGLLEVLKENNGFKVKEIWSSVKMQNQFSSSILYERYLYGFNNHILTCMDFTTGKIMWRERGYNKGSLIGIDGHMIILGEKGNLALAELSHKGFIEKSQYDLFPHKKCWSVPVVSDGRLYIRNEEEIVCLDIMNN